MHMGLIPVSFKIQELRSLDDSKRRTNIIFFYEAHFHIVEYMNKQHCCICWKTFISARNDYLWSVFSRNDVGKAVTIARTRYYKVITEFLSPQLNYIKLEHM